MAVFLIFCLIWLLLTAFGTFMGYGILEDVPILKIAVYSCLISWCVSLVFVLLRYQPKGNPEKEKEDGGGKKEQKKPAEKN